LKLSLVDEAETSTAVRTFEQDVVAVGHRIVHGGSRFVEPVVVDDDVVRELEAVAELAPLHNGPALRALGDARAALPDVPHVAAFDTAFHATLPPEASTYAVPARWREDGLRRYGFHGLSVAWAAEQVRVPRVVVCHLGGGCSVTAVRDGRSVDTTMGLTPLEGLVMATRSGSVDPGLLLHLLRGGLAPDELERALEEESGLLGLSELSPHVHELEASPDERARLALAIYVRRIAQAVGAAAVALGGIDALVFTGGVGERSEWVRGSVRDAVGFLGAVRVEVVASREDVVIARAARHRS
jgi:acetate kinase